MPSLGLACMYKRVKNGEPTDDQSKKESVKRVVVGEKLEDFVIKR